MDKVYVFGHKVPDTDSVTSAIALTELKIKQEMNASPRVLGDINSETKFVLDYFGFPQPEYLNDVKLQIKNLEYQKNYFLNMYESIYTAYNYMSNNSISNLPIIDENKKLIGIISMKDIAKDHIKGDIYKLHTSYDNIIEALDGEEITRFDEIINGKIIVPSYRSTTFINKIKIDNNSVLIMGDRHSIHEYAITNMAKLIILSKNSIILDEHLEIAKKNGVNIIRTSYDTFQVTRMISLCNYVHTISNKTNIVYFNELDTVEDFEEIATKTKYSNYPVLNQQRQCLGLIHISDLSEKNRKKVILVDHNEEQQSVLGIEQAEILEIVDHHKIGSIGTTLPINFRNMPVGSTNTIVYLLYKENNVEIDKSIAGLMLAGIISDTLLLKSPTTTQIDINVLNELAIITEIDVNDFAKKMFDAASSLDGKTKEEIIFSDFKKFTVKDYQVGIGQIFSTNPSVIKDNIEDYLSIIEKSSKDGDYHIFAVFVTDILNQGSFILYSQGSKYLLSESLKVTNLEQWSFIKDCLSRKKQIVPSIMNFIKSK
ncbi:MAG: putative manganese-dependent inorganic diphosphatase [Bacilli bacterium]